jgi:uncharacterized protein (TIGR02996 family)
VTRTGGPAGQTLRVDPQQNRVQVRGPGEDVRLTVEDFPGEGEWSLATFAGDGSVLFLAQPGGVRLFRYMEPPPPPQGRGPAAGLHREQAPLLAAILDAPDDDAPRLVYADWLEEHGDPARAEFIRLQLVLAARMRDGPVGSSSPEAERANDLLRENGSRWLAELPAIRGVRWGHFWRGFPSVEVSSPVTLVWAARRLAECNPVEWVRLDYCLPERVAHLARSAVLERVRVLEGVYIDYTDDQTGDILFGSPRLAGLRGLDPSYLNPQSLRAVASSPHLGALEWLDFLGFQMSEASVEALAEAPGLPALRWLRLTAQDIDAELLGRLRARFPRVIYRGEG